MPRRHYLGESYDDKSKTTNVSVAQPSKNPSSKNPSSSEAKDFFSSIAYWRNTKKDNESEDNESGNTTNVSVAQPVGSSENDSSNEKKEKFSSLAFWRNTEEDNTSEATTNRNPISTSRHNKEDGEESNNTYKKRKMWLLGAAGLLIIGVIIFIIVYFSTKKTKGSTANDAKAAANAAAKAAAKKKVESTCGIVEGNSDVFTGQADFTPYCYDYNDVGSSPYLKPPYKMLMVFSDLDRPNYKEDMELEKQNDKTIQIVNNDCSDYLHVFFQTSSTTIPWDIDSLSPSKTVKNKVFNWKQHAIDPMGSDIFHEYLLPKGKTLIVKIPVDVALTKQGTFAARIFGITGKNDKLFSNYTSINELKALNFMTSPIMMEGGMDMVADVTAVDGVNVNMAVQLTTDNNKTEKMYFSQNPCLHIDKSYWQDENNSNLGCFNPAKMDCGFYEDDKDKVTCDCIDATQDCRFNKCSNLFFKIPDNLQKYQTKHDGGKQDEELVKPFINNNNNVCFGSALNTFCDDLHSLFKGKISRTEAQKQPCASNPDTKFAEERKTRTPHNCVTHCMSGQFCAPNQTPCPENKCCDNS